MSVFAVITEIPDDDYGNYAVSELLIVPNPKKSCVGANLIVDPARKDGHWEHLFSNAVVLQDYIRFIDLRDEQMLFCNTPVFQLGEILTMDSPYGRTIPDGRKPSKWFVSYKVFDNIEDAIACAKRVYGGAP